MNECTHRYTYTDTHTQTHTRMHKCSNPNQGPTTFDSVPLPICIDTLSKGHYVKYKRSGWQNVYYSISIVTCHLNGLVTFSFTQHQQLESASLSTPSTHSSDQYSLTPPLWGGRHLGHIKTSSVLSFPKPTSLNWVDVNNSLIWVMTHIAIKP